MEECDSQKRESSAAPTARAHPARRRLSSSDSLPKRERDVVVELEREDGASLGENGAANPSATTLADAWDARLSPSSAPTFAERGTGGGLSGDRGASSSFSSRPTLPGDVRRCGASFRLASLSAPIRMILIDPPSRFGFPLRRRYPHDSQTL